MLTLLPLDAIEQMSSQRRATTVRRMSSPSSPNFRPQAQPPLALAIATHDTTFPLPRSRPN